MFARITIRMGSISPSLIRRQYSKLHLNNKYQSVKYCPEFGSFFCFWRSNFIYSFRISGFHDVLFSWRYCLLKLGCLHRQPCLCDRRWNAGSCCSGLFNAVEAAFKGKVWSHRRRKRIFVLRTGYFRIGASGDE